SHRRNEYPKLGRCPVARDRGWIARKRHWSAYRSLHSSSKLVMTCEVCHCESPKLIRGERGKLKCVECQRAEGWIRVSKDGRPSTTPTCQDCGKPMLQLQVKVVPLVVSAENN